MAFCPMPGARWAWGNLVWFKKGLTAKDKLHFSSKGYALQGELLYRALKNGYLDYKEHTH